MDIEELEQKYMTFFQKASAIYGTSGGHNSLLSAINSGELRDGLNNRQYRLAKKTLLRFFHGRNTRGSDRVFGIYDIEIDELIKKCVKSRKNLISLFKRES